MHAACWRGRRSTGSVIARGTRLIMGNALVARLLYSLNQLRVSNSLPDADSPNSSWTAGEDCRRHFQNRATATSPSRANKGVVLATGGIGWNSELRERLFPEGGAALFAVAREQYRRWHCSPANGRKARIEQDSTARPCGCRAR